MAHGDAREGKWMINWRMEWVASTLHTTSEHSASSITTADAHTSAASSRLNWRPRRYKWTRPFRRKKKSGFCACAITFQLASTAAFILNLGTRCRGFVNSTLPSISSRETTPLPTDGGGWEGTRPGLGDYSNLRELGHMVVVQLTALPTQLSWLIDSVK